MAIAGQRVRLDNLSKSKWKPYPEYKDSDVEWLGEVPSHWKVKRLRFCCDVNPPKSELNGIAADLPVSFLPMESIGIDGTLSLAESRALSDVYQGFTYFRDGDIIIAKITPCFENGKGALCAGLTNGVGFGTTELHVARPSETVDPRFIFSLTKSHPFRNLGIASMTGVAGQQRVSEGFLKDFRVPLPPLSEQRAIADFLDRETARIDALISKKERLIELLNEKRTAVISHAVTKGLDPTVPMKDSGVEWLGQIPAHWEVKPLMWLTAAGRPIMYGIVLPGPNVDDGIPIVKGGDVAPGRLSLANLSKTTREIEAGCARSRLRGGDVVYAIRGSIGSAEIVPNELTGANLTQDAARISPRESIEVRWLLYALKSTPVFAQLDSGAGGATIRGINIRDLKRARIPVPPRAEQESIADHLVERTRRTDALAHTAQEHIDLLREYRTALISAAVTGKIDVREKD